MATRYKTVLALVLAINASSALAIGVEVGGDVTQTTQADNIINFAAGSDITAEQTLASIRGNVSVSGDVRQTVSADNIINFGAGSKIIARQTISSIDSH